MTISLRRSRRDDGPEVIEVWRRSVDATHHFLTARHRCEIEEQVKSFLPDAPLWVAVNADDKPVAFMLLSDSHMDALFVDPAYRGAGTGRLLVTQALALIPGLTTDVNEQNEQAVGFYLKLGFQVTGRKEQDDSGRPYPLLSLRYQG